MEKTPEAIYNLLKVKIKETENLHGTCEQLLDATSGREKLQRKIESELRFLRKLSNQPEKLKEEHLRSSNLCHLSAIVKCCAEMPGVVKILEPFTYQEKIDHCDQIHTTNKRVVVDIVSDHGKTWVKVVARNPHALLQSSLGAGKFGRRSIVEQVEDMKTCASQNLYMYTCPRILVWFATGVARDLKVRLEEMGVTVSGTTVDSNYVSLDYPDDDDSTQPKTAEKSADIFAQSCCSNSFQSESEYLQSPELEVDLSNQNVQENDCLNEIYKSVVFSDLSNMNKDFNLYSVPPKAVLNLDVSTMIAQVSNLTNGFCNFQFQEEILSDQARREKLFPVRRLLDPLFRDHKLVCCQTAYQDFIDILSTVGGEEEKVRASKMLNNVTVLPDNPSERALGLQISTKVRERSKIIFGTGENLKAITVTANLGFLRSAQSQGIKFVALVHGSRALTEQKEKTAQLLA